MSSHEAPVAGSADATPPGDAFPDELDGVGFVVVARNGGERLRDSLRSVLVHGRPVVYADSASTDGSTHQARDLGAQVVEVDGSARQTAARGRNAGFARLRDLMPHVAFVQFVDGDTTLDAGWPRAAARAMRSDPTLAVVCGRLRERQIAGNPFSRLFDLEWDGPVGEIRACGGIAMFRASAFLDAQGFDAALVAGEEANLCARLIERGGRVARLDAPMGEHASGIDRLSQWWRRTARVGYAYARAAAGGEPTDANKSRQVASATLWAAGMPAIALAAALGGVLLPGMWRGLAWGGLALALGAYGLLLWRIYRGVLARGRPAADARLYAAFCLLAKWPQLQGQLRYWLGRGA